MSRRADTEGRSRWLGRRPGWRSRRQQGAGSMCRRTSCSCSHNLLSKTLMIINLLSSWLAFTSNKSPWYLCLSSKPIRQNILLSGQNCNRCSSLLSSHFWFLVRMICCERIQSTYRIQLVWDECYKPQACLWLPDYRVCRSNMKSSRNECQVSNECWVCL